VRRNKFKAISTRGFASKLEAAGYDWLKNREASGEIRDIKCQQAVTLAEGNGHKLRWKIDFSFIVVKTGELEYCEIKGKEMADYRIKLELFKMNPPAALTIVKGTYRKLFIAERIEKCSPK
jgi:hypothetical protein